MIHSVHIIEVSAWKQSKLTLIPFQNAMEMFSFVIARGNNVTIYILGQYLLTGLCLTRYTIFCYSISFPCP